MCRDEQRGDAVHHRDGSDVLEVPEDVAHALTRLDVVDHDGLQGEGRGDRGRGGECNNMRDMSDWRLV